MAAMAGGMLGMVGDRHVARVLWRDYVEHVGTHTYTHTHTHTPTNYILVILSWLSWCVFQQIVSTAVGTKNLVSFLTDCLGDTDGVD